MAEEKNSNFFEIDSNLSKNKKYRDDYETFLKKIKSNFIDEKELTTNDLTTIDQVKKDDSEIHWNQFKENNINSTYNINEYTTELNKDLIPEEVKKKAEQIEKEILNSDTQNNSHIIEERYNKHCFHKNEEEQYSSVVRGDKINSKKYISYILFSIFIIIVSFCIYKLYCNKQTDEEDDNDFE